MAQPLAGRVAAAETVGITHLEYADGRFEAFLSRLDPSTLRPRGPRVDVGEFHDNWSLSPDGRYVALGTGGQGLGIMIYDLQRVKLVRAVRTGIAAESVAWLTPTRIVAVLQSNRLVVVDPSTGLVLREQPLARNERACGSTPTTKPAVAAARGLLVMLRGRSGAGSRLLHMQADGRVRSVTLPAGVSWGCGRAGLAVDADGGRAFVVSRASKVAEVKLSTMTVRYHELAGTPLRDALPRDVSWLGEGKLVASGRDRAGRPAGVSIIDTATWTNRVIDPRAGTARGAAGAVLTYDGYAVLAPRGRGLGLSVYRADGRRVFRALVGRQVKSVHHAGTSAYAVLVERTVRTFDLTTGRPVGTHTAPAARVDFTLLI